ncbi:MAG: hypothetical protein JW963_08730 [Anaerolineales bacterium]|nr:hypothetical protein [Anaerolineales bacterium]
MKNTIARFSLSISKINKNHLQIAFTVLALAMLVIGAGAPDDMGGVGR